MSVLKLRVAQEQSNTPVSNIFIEEYMPKANPVYVTIYLYGLKHCYLGSAEITTETIAEALGVLETDVLRALQYWQEEGLVKMDGNGSIEFLPVRSKAKKMPKPILLEQPKKEAQKAVVTNKPRYSTKELDIYMENSPEVRRLFQLAQKHLGKLLTFNDMCTIFSFYDWLMLPIDVIDFLLTHCAKENHRNVHYLEKVALDWADHNIRTVDEAKDHLNLYNISYRDIMKSMGISSREPIETEMEYMNKWVQVFQMPMEIIKLACNKTVMQTGKASFAYADSILASWHKNGVQNQKDVEKFESAYHDMKKERPQEKTKEYAPKKNRFVNYEQRNWDFAELEKLEKQYIQKRLEG